MFRSSWNAARKCDTDETTMSAPARQPEMDGFKFEHILISVTIAHNRSIGQFDDSCAHQIEKAMKGYQGILMVDAQVQYRHGSAGQHAKDCACGLCNRVRQSQERTEVAPVKGI